MRIVLDVVDNIFGSIRLIILLIFGAAILFGLFMTVGAAVIAPKAVEVAADRAERVGNRAIAAAQEEERNERLADEGWGYSEPQSGSGASYSDGELSGGWGDD